MGDYTSELSELLPETTPSASTAGIGINVKRLLKLRGRMMALVFFLIAGAGIAAVWMNIPAYYVASAQLEYLAKQQGLMKDNARSDTQRIYDNNRNTQIEIITSPTTINRFLSDDEKLNSVPGLAALDGGRLHYILANLYAMPDKSSEIINVYFNDIDPDTAEGVVNLVIEAFIEYTDELNLQRGGDAIQQLRGSEKSLQTRLDTLNTELIKLGDELGVPVYGDIRNRKLTVNPVTEETLATLQKEWSKARGEMQTKKQMLETANSSLAQYKKDKTIPIYLEDIAGKIELDPTVQSSSLDLELSKNKYQTAKDTFVDDHPRVQAYRKDVDRQSTLLESRRNSVRGTLIQQVVNQYSSALEIAKSAVDEAQVSVDEWDEKLAAEKRALLSENKKLGSIESLRDEIDLVSKEKSGITQRLVEYEIENEGPARVSIVGYASTSGTPDQSKRVKYALMSILAGFSIAIGLGVVREFADQNIRSAQDVSYVTDYPVLASIPHTSEDRIAKGANLATISYDYPNSMTSDQYRQTVARMLHWATNGHNIKTCAITSPLPGEGKSTLACNLAIALAQADRRVLLVDINARNPEIEKNFGLEPDIGITDMLSGDSLVRDPDRETSVPNLFVVGPGLRNEDLIERLASKEMTDFIHGAERLFDNVIIDTPACLLASEAKLLAPIVSSVIMTTQAGKASFGQLRRSLRSIEENGGTIMGIVVTAVKHVTGGYLRENMDMYYKHDTVSVKEKNGKSKTLSPSRTPVLSSKDRHPDEEL
jgi:capsular exopolysaccharide synthesis family protein